MTEELPDKSAVRSTTSTIGRAQLAARVDISYKSVTGDSDEMVWMSHAHSRRIHDDHLDGTFYMSNHLGLSRLKSGDRSCGQLYNQGRHCLLDRAHNGSVICCVTHVCVTSTPPPSPHIPPAHIKAKSTNLLEIGLILCPPFLHTGYLPPHTKFIQDVEKVLKFSANSVQCTI